MYLLTWTVATMKYFVVTNSTLLLNVDWWWTEMQQRTMKCNISVRCLYHGAEISILEQTSGGNMLFITIPWDREQLGRFFLLPLMLFAP